MKFCERENEIDCDLATSTAPRFYSLGQREFYWNFFLSINCRNKYTKLQTVVRSRRRAGISSFRDYAIFCFVLGSIILETTHRTISTRIKIPMKNFEALWSKLACLAYCINMEGIALFWLLLLLLFNSLLPKRNAFCVSFTTQFSVFRAKVGL